MGNQEPYSESVHSLRKTFMSRKTRSLEWRKQQLQNLSRMLTECADQWCDALYKDLHKPVIQAKFEVYGQSTEAQYAIKNLSSWSKPQSASVSIANWPASGQVVSEPLGVVCIFGAWNFPVSLTFGPLIAAIAAGNCAVIKPSDMAPTTATLMSKLLPTYLDTEAFTVVLGGPEECTALLEKKFDHIFYTGGERVGRIVYAAAAKHLTPVTLELGGKSPVIVDTSANLEVTARRLLWGKDLNCGQICVAPDYVMVLQDIQEEFYAEMKKQYNEFYPSGNVDPDSYGRIIDDRNTRRLMALLNEDEDTRGSIVVGGKSVDEKSKLISPTVFRDTKQNSKLMQDEIFGPLLPCFSIASLDEGLDFINSRPKPLSAYIFSQSQSRIDRFVNETSSGSVVINEVVLHVTESGLPFGGVGSSGIGNYKGKAGFLTFSHQKSVMHKSGRSFFDPSVRYPPMTEQKIWITEKLL